MVEPSGIEPLTSTLPVLNVRSNQSYYWLYTVVLLHFTTITPVFLHRLTAISLRFVASLTMGAMWSNFDSVTAKSVAWISLQHNTGAQAPIERFFYARVLAGCMGALSSAPRPVCGKANPVQSVAIGLASDSDGFILIYRSLTMTNHTQVAPATFINLSANYQIAPDSDPLDLFDDASTLLFSIAESLRIQLDDPGRIEINSLYFLVIMAKASLDAGHNLVIQNGGRHDG